jgi:hypothetical protein
VQFHTATLSACRKAGSLPPSAQCSPAIYRFALAAPSFPAVLFPL